MFWNRKRIKAIIYRKNRQAVIKKVVPQNLSFEIDGQSYIIDKENFYMHKGVACYSYLEQVPAPLALKSLLIQKDGTETVAFEDVMMSAEELSIFKRSKSAKEVLNSIEKSMSESILSIVSIAVTIIGLGLLYFVLQSQISLIIEQLSEFTALLGVE